MNVNNMFTNMNINNNMNNNLNINNMMINSQNIGFSNREMIINLLNQNNEMMNQISMNNNLIIQLMNNPNDFNGPNNMINNINSFNNIESNQNEEDYFPGNKNKRYDILFSLDTGLKIIIRTPIDVKVRDLLSTFARAMKVDIKYLGEKIFFLFNGCKINKNEEKTIIQFDLHNRSTITVIDSSNLIGGKNEI